MLSKRVAKSPPKMAKALLLQTVTEKKAYDHFIEDSVITHTNYKAHFLILKCLALLFKVRSYMKYARVT